MNILGLNLGHETSCTLIKKCKIVAACEEERYIKLKHTSTFHINSINDSKDAILCFLKYIIDYLVIADCIVKKK